MTEGMEFSNGTPPLPDVLLGAKDPIAEDKVVTVVLRLLEACVFARDTPVT